MAKRLPYGTPLGDRFWAKVKRGPHCWEWQAAVKRGEGLLPYGIFSIGTSRSTVAHRVAYEIAVGPIPVGLCVLHRCDNPLCVRPSHLFLGTRGDNNTDRRTKGRDRHPRSWCAKLTDAQVREIRARFSPRKVTHAQLAYEYGLGASGIYKIIHRLSYRDVI